MLWFYCAFLAQTSLHLIPTAQSSDQLAFLQPSHRTVLHPHPIVSGSHLVPFVKFDDGAACLKIINVSMKDSYGITFQKTTICFSFFYIWNKLIKSFNSNAWTSCMSHYMRYILFWTSYFRISSFIALLPLLCIFQFFFVLIVTNLVSVSYFIICKFGQFFGTGTNEWYLGENYACQNDGWRFCGSWIGSCYVTSHV